MNKYDCDAVAEYVVDYTTSHIAVLPHFQHAYSRLSLRIRYSRSLDKFCKNQNISSLLVIPGLQKLGTRSGRPAVVIWILWSADSKSFL